ncbi:bifunctional tetrahydrofolate synthase/dihydrofolate synthase [Algibacillus agarilyticus]|uniref:bifunctional tetrahydrofolate synthase/dihydrofolate synthase n=1 Tax=Algibacillus agarilyticus TaxID=2234133 RepID=UPI000DCF9451|nr:bifunctional tetrahydrofolate synthase/dihydrofolate synthase [Algibacillus agarilyticus]
MKFDSLSAWLTHLESIHPSNIELGLSRVKTVFDALALDFTASKIVLIGGTNGKGTTCHLLQNLLTSQGYRVGCYNSPHMVDYRERTTLDNEWFTEVEHCAAFEQIELARKETLLTYFEMGTLAALCLLAKAKPDYILLEVGLGGRLDATNIIEPDLSIITTVALDHLDWLGDTREKIGYEKAGIMRHNKPCICGDLEPPTSLLKHAASLNTSLYCAQQDYKWQENSAVWHYQGSHAYTDLPVPNMPIQNAAGVLKALEILNVTISVESIRSILSRFKLQGRWQTVKYSPHVIVDVGHNEQAATYILNQLDAHLMLHPHVNVSAVVGMLKDKAVEETLKLFIGKFTRWYLASTDGPRGTSSEYLASVLPASEKKQLFPHVLDAYQGAINDCASNDLILVFGSFLVVSDVIQKESYCV